MYSFSSQGLTPKQGCQGFPCDAWFPWVSFARIRRVPIDPSPVGSLSDQDPVETSENHWKHVCPPMLVFFMISNLISNAFRNGLGHARELRNSIRVDRICLLNLPKIRDAELFRLSALFQLLGLNRKLFEEVVSDSFSALFRFRDRFHFRTEQPTIYVA